jgi:hypothetical protein
MQRLLVGVLGALVIGVGVAHAATTTRTVRLDGRYKWGSSARSCVAPRAGSVICVAAKGKVAGLGAFAYARDAVSTGGHTNDGCEQFSTHGTLWANGGHISFRGGPAATCGSDPQQPNSSPDANYVVSFVPSSGKGVLAKASGKFTILADQGTDIWAGSIVLKK